MPDREKVIDDLKGIDDEAYDRWVHCQFTRDKLLILIRDAIPDAIALLREQEPVEPTEMDVTPVRMEYSCGRCGGLVGIESAIQSAEKYRHVYCPKCGRKVKWNE